MLMQRIQNYVSIGFHRFLSRSPTPVRITLDMLDLESGACGIPIDIDPLDPFDYDQSGNSAFPAAMFLDGEYEGRISIKAHIWPPNSSSPSYKLPGGTNSRQGFYFYRNDRLIQGGGWNGLRETEPHSSLAKLEIDVVSDFDVEVSLDVKKVEIQLPPSLAESIQKAKTIQGIDFKKYLSIADNTYRTRKILEKELPLIPSLGLPAELRIFLHRELRIKSTAKHRDLKIKWKRLSKELFFEIDRDAGELYINKEYRNARRLNRSSRNRRAAPLTRRRILDQLTAPSVWGTHIEHTVIEMDAERSRSPKWIAQNQSQLCRVSMLGTHKNPRNRLFLKSLEERYGTVSLRNDMAPEGGLEPTTLRLTASEFPSRSPAIVCCKSLYKSKLENTASTVHRYRYCLIATDFERAWAQKWVQSFQ
jgi:hypothetical protein